MMVLYNEVSLWSFYKKLKINKNFMQKTAHWFLVIGGLDLLLLGISGWDIGQLFGGQGAIISRIIYILIGLAALVALKPKSSATPVAPTTPQQM